MSKTITTLFAAFMTLGTLTATTGPSIAANPNFTGQAILKINGQGFRTCKAQGNRGYTAVARGIASGGNARSGLRSFQVRTCFESRAQCDRFISRIHHKIGGIQRLNYAGCTARG